ncbi:beta-galactoside alpha-2,6-sialyltransferase 1 [Lepeophtheirus salmonis]|uniref:beta-galactoside alpha-2,6-sialyltransferase 1 n=1 Tax=Lepeophtheirus salmonis TaxID=72036 RepID=UPI001AE61739|nr:beta-galactoside alpha-2,6-sialyltransferase 1-like [Lepeophtheirus salmonis]
MSILRYILFIFLLSYLFIICFTEWQRVSNAEDFKDIYSSRSTLQINNASSKLVVRHSEEELEEIRRIEAFEQQVVYNLRKNHMFHGKKILAGDFENRFKVNFKGQMGSRLEIRKSPLELLCDMKNKVKLHIFQQGDPFFRSKKLDQYFMYSPVLSNKTFNSCAIVTNSGSLINSGLGTFIDSHDIVIRFNGAPTSGYEKDVGSKTSLRVVNSQVLYKFENEFKNFNSLSPVIVWDPTNYNASVREWYSNPDMPFFDIFFAQRRMKPEEPLYLLHPGSLWSLWDWLQSQLKWPIVPNPTTSGFLGLAIAVQHCSIVRTFEYIPSLRYFNKCHYYGMKVWTQYGSGHPCTYGSWHPVSSEKLMTLALNIGKKKEIYSDGFVTIPGFPSLKC